MLDQQDMTLLRGMFDDILTQKLGQALEQNNLTFGGELRTEFKQMLQQNNIDLKRDIRDEVHSLLAATENRVVIKMDKMKTDIISEVTDFIGTAVLPQIEELQTDMIIVKNYLKLA